MADTPWLVVDEDDLEEGERVAVEVRAAACAEAGFPPWAVIADAIHFDTHPPDDVWERAVELGRLAALRASAG